MDSQWGNWQEIINPSHVTLCLTTKNNLLKNHNQNWHGPMIFDFMTTVEFLVPVMVISVLSSKLSTKAWADNQAMKVPIILKSEHIVNQLGQNLRNIYYSSNVHDCPSHRKQLLAAYNNPNFLPSASTRGLCYLLSCTLNFCHVCFSQSLTWVYLRGTINVFEGVLCVKSSELVID